MSVAPFFQPVRCRGKPNSIGISKNVLECTFECIDDLDFFMDKNTEFRGKIYKYVLYFYWKVFDVVLWSHILAFITVAAVV